MTTNDRDTLIKFAISTPRNVEAPADLSEAIYRQVRATRQQRGLGRLGRLGWLPTTSPAFFALVLLALVAIALIAIGLARPPNRPHLMSMYHGGPDRTGVMVGPGPEGVPVAAWDVTRPGPLPFTTMPLVEDGRVYVADGSGAVAALDATSGGTIWEAHAGSAVRGTPVLLDDLLIVATDGGEAIAFRTANGTQAWATLISAAPISASLLEADGRIYAGSEDGTLVALDGHTGDLLWKRSAGGPVLHGAALADGVLYFGATGGHFSALDAVDRSLRWSLELGSGGISTPVIGPSMVYVGRGMLADRGPHDLVAIDRAAQTIRWTFAAPSGLQTLPGALANGLLYGVSDDGSVYALDAATGVLRWTAPANGAVGFVGFMGGSIVGNVLYVSSADRTVRAFDATTGRQLWQVAVVGVPTMAAVVDGSLFIGTNLGHVVAIRDPPTVAPTGMSPARSSALP